jgi:hypothetical protein
MGIMRQGREQVATAQLCVCICTQRHRNTTYLASKLQNLPSLLQKRSDLRYVRVCMFLYVLVRMHRMSPLRRNIHTCIHILLTTSLTVHDHLHTSQTARVSPLRRNIRVYMHTILLTTHLQYMTTCTHFRLIVCHLEYLRKLDSTLRNILCKTPCKRFHNHEHFAMCCSLRHEQVSMRWKRRDMHVHAAGSIRAYAYFFLGCVAKRRDYTLRIHIHTHI